MTKRREDLADGSDEQFCTVQPERNLEANFEVDIAKKLEVYLEKIGRSVISDGDDGEVAAVNFAEGSVVFSLI